MKNHLSSHCRRSCRALALAAALFASAAAARAQTVNLPANVSIDMQQTTQAGETGATASNDGTTTNDTALNYNNSRNDTNSNAEVGSNRINRNLTTSANLSYNGATTFTGALDSYGSRNDGGNHTTGITTYAVGTGAISFTVNASAPYSVSGSFMATITSGTPQSLGQVELTNGSGAVIFNENYSTTTTATDPFNNNLTGTLAPGNYTLFFVDECLFSGMNGTIGAGDLDYTFQVGTVPEPGTWAGGGLTLGALGWTLHRRTRAARA